MNLISVDKLKNGKNKVVFNCLPKACHGEYIASLTKDTVRINTFHGAMKLIVIIGQFFGLNPVLGVSQNDASKLSFSWSSWRCVYSMLSILGQALFLSMCTFHILMQREAGFSASTSIVFYGTNFLTTVLFLNLGRKWPKLCQHISKIEVADPNVITTIEKKCTISCLLILSMALLEHLLSNLSSLAIVMACQPEKKYFEGFVLQSYPFVFSYVTYSNALGILVQFINIQCTFNWSFSNLFLICLSWYLEARLQQINDRIRAVRRKHVPSSFWRKTREDYNNATNLVRKVDEVFSFIIFISFANNLFAICWQLLHLLEEGFRIGPVCGVAPEDRPMMHGFEQVVYFAFSFGFLMARSLAVSIIPARIFTASKDTARGLYDVPATAYCVEVQRFIEQVHGDNVALSGLQFFSIKRGLVLTITGTIVTYELVLMQFTGVSPTAAPTPAAILLNVSTSSTP